MPPPLRWLVLLVLVTVFPYFFVQQVLYLPMQSLEIPHLAGLICAGVFTVLTIVCAVQLPVLYTRYYEAKKLSGNNYQNLLREYAKSCQKLNLKAPELYLISDGAPHAFGVGIFPGQRRIFLTRGLVDTLDPDQLIAYIDYVLVLMSKGHVAPMTFGAGAAYAALLPLKLADLIDSDALRVVLIIAFFGWFGAIYIQASGLRSQSYELDQLAGKVHSGTGHLALATALAEGNKINFKHPLNRIDYSSAPLFVVNPLGSKGVAAIFTTHAPTAKRVKKLQRAGTRIAGKEAVAKSKGLV